MLAILSTTLLVKHSFNHEGVAVRGESEKEELLNREVNANTVIHGA